MGDGLAGSGIFTYARRAFLYHWNLLAVGGASAFSLLSGRPDVFLPLTLAAELGYLVVLSTSERFQRYVDALEREGERLEDGDNLLTGRAQKIFAELLPADQKRFERLRDLCQELLKIAEGTSVQAQPDSLSSMHLANINRMLWIFLKLLYSKAALDRFFATTQEGEIRERMDEALRKLKALGPEGSDTAERAKQRASLKDIVETSELRLLNFRKARENHEYLQIELERLYSKIAGVAEMGINRQNPSTVTSEIDVVSSSAIETERAIHEIDAITGFDSTYDRAPPLLTAQPPTWLGRGG